MSTHAKIDVVQLMQEIRQRAVAKRSGGDMVEDSLSFSDSAASLTKLNDLLTNLRAACARLDDHPPQPPTLRGRLGAMVVKLVRRALFWQYAQARAFSNASTSMLAEVCTALEQSYRKNVTVSESISAATKQGDRAIDIAQGLENRLIALEGRIEEVEQRLQQRIDQVMHDAEKRVEQRQDSLTFNATITRLERRLAELDKYAHQTRRDTTLQSARLEALSWRLQKSGASSSSPEPEPAPEAGLAMDTLYLAFEDAYRGDPGEIKERLSAYLPVLTEYGVTPELGSALDIGCGRGEWLELLRGAGFDAKGCDINADMVQTCKDRGLNVERTDALRYLRSTPPESLAVISAMHVIEHLPLKTIIEFLDASLAALKPGGILILESPNPQNVLVGAHTFYLDPTHQRPLPMQLTHFLLEARGFFETRAFGLHPYPSSICIQENSQVAQRFNEYFYGPQDYAVIGRRV